MNTEEWQHFTSVPPRSDRNRFHVTIGKNGNMLINRAVFERMGSPAAVHIFFNPRTAAILFKPARPRDTGAFPFVEQRCGTHRVIRTNALCTHYRVKPERTIKFISPRLHEDRTLELHFTDTIEIGSLKRKP